MRRETGSNCIRSEFKMFFNIKNIFGSKSTQRSRVRISKKKELKSIKPAWEIPSQTAALQEWTGVAINSGEKKANVILRCVNRDVIYKIQSWQFCIAGEASGEVCAWFGAQHWKMLTKCKSLLSRRTIWHLGNLRFKGRLNKSIMFRWKRKRSTWKRGCFPSLSCLFTEV